MVSVRHNVCISVRLSISDSAAFALSDQNAVDLNLRRQLLDNGLLNNCRNVDKISVYDVIKQVQAGQIIRASVDGMKPVVESDDQLLIKFMPLRENRLHVNVQLRPDDVTGRLILRSADQSQQSAIIAALSFTLPDVIADDSKTRTSLQDDDDWRHEVTTVTKTVITKTELKLADIAEKLDTDWVAVAVQLGLSKDYVEQIQTDYSHPAEQVTHLFQSFLMSSANDFPVLLA